MENQPSRRLLQRHQNLSALPEDLYRLALNHIQQSILLIDTDFRVVIANEFVRKISLRLTGKEPEVGMSIFELEAPELRADLQRVYERVFHGSIEKITRKYLVEEGPLVLEFEFRPAYDQDGSMIGALVTGTDISEAKKAEEKLKEAEERWRFALEGANQGAWDWNLRTGEIFYSPSYRRLYGYSDDDPLDNIEDWKQKIHPDDQDRMNQAIRDHLESANPYYETTYRIRAKDGSYKWIWARGMIMDKDQTGKPQRMIGTHTDITDQINAETQYKTLFKANPQPCWIYDPHSLRFLEVNKATVETYGYTEEEFLSNTLFLVHPVSQHAELMKELEIGKSKTELAFNNWTQIKKNGETIFVDLRTTSIIFQGKEARLAVVHNVTEKVLTEQALRKSNERFELAAKATLEALWEWNIETDEVYLSPVYEEMFGYKIEQGRKYSQWEQHIHPEDRHEVTSNFYRSLQDPSITTWQKEYRYQKADGSYIYVTDHCIIIRNAEGKPTKVVGAYQNISRRKHAEQELIRSNERFYYAAKASSEALWELDFETGRFYASEAYTDIFGWQVEEHGNFAHWHLYIHPEDRNESVDSFNNALNDAGVHSWKKEFRFRRIDGTYAHVIVKASILRGHLGQALRVIGAIQDISDQKKTEEHLRASNERFQLVNKATSDAIYDWNIVTNELYWGEGIQTLFGFPPSEVNFEKWVSLVHPSDRSRVEQTLINTIADPNANLWKEEYRLARADGTYSYVLERGFVIRDANGKGLRLIGSLQDITDRHYNEQLLSIEKMIFEQSTNPNLDFSSIVVTLLRSIEDMHEDVFTSVLLLKDNNTIATLAAPRIPLEFQKALEGQKVGPREGSCGSAMSTKQMVIVEDIENDPLWEHYRDLALSYGFRACWSIPIIHSSGKVMGSFAVYYKKVKSPSSQELNTFTRIKNILRILMENNWWIRQMKETNERFDIMMKATHDLIWDWNLETNYIYRDELGLQKVYGISDNDSIQDFTKWIERIHPEDIDRVTKVINHIVRAHDENHFEVEYRFRRDDGTYSHVYDRGIILRNSDNKPIRMIGAAQDVTERKRLEHELLLNELEKQKAINQATVDTQEQERTQIGKELHDNVNQVLTTTKLYLDLALSSPELKDELIQKSNKNIINVINEIRQLSRSLMDPSIGDLGLVDSINDLVDNINLTRKLHVKVFSDKKIENLLDQNHKLTVFRIIQETLNNAIRHAKATTVEIRFAIGKNDVEISIEDDGVGFDPAAVKKGAGLKNIQNRIYLINGTHTIESAPGKGCKIVIKFPIIKQPQELPN